MDARPQAASGARRWNPWCVVGAAVLPLLVLFILFLADVPLGRPQRLVYRYSPVSILRLERTWPVWLVGACGLAAWAAAMRGTGQRRIAGLAAVGIAYAAVIAWTFLLPPKPMEQHAFNLLSPSHDGAFVLEAEKIRSLSAYLESGFFDTLQKEPEQMRGRRVLSNPPGVTIAAAALQWSLEPGSAWHARLVALFGLEGLESAQEQHRFASALLLGVAFVLAWGLSLLPAYGVCRLWLAPPAASAVAFACSFNPATLNFSPGKDSAQMLSVMAFGFCWLTAYVRGRAHWGWAAGVVLAGAAMIGLIHLWIAMILAAATFWHAWRTDDGGGHPPPSSSGGGRESLIEGWLPSLRRVVRPWLLGCALPCAGGFGLAAAVLHFFSNGNLFKVILAVGVRYGQIQEEIITTPLYWTLWGLPLFLLFVGPLFFIQAMGLRVDRRDGVAAMGGALIVATCVAAAYSYFFANNSETPRLWIPFLPWLLIGMALRRSALRETAELRPAPYGPLSALAALPVLLMALQLGITVLHACLMDVRESEWRLFTTQRFWD